MDPLNLRSRASAIGDYFLTHRLQLILIVVAVVIGLLWTAIEALRPLPPRTVVMATGPEGSDYDTFGEQYREILARSGVELKLLPTAGALENLALLKDRRSSVDVGFLQSGITSEKDSPGIESLGTVFYEPLWLFHRAVYRGKGREVMRGKKISVGPEGSGGRELTVKLLAMNGIDQSAADFLPLTPQEAADELVRGKIDVAFMMTSWDSPVVQRLLHADGVDFATFPRVDAYIALYPYLSKVELPEGVVDLAKDRPPSNVCLFAEKASLAVRGDLHPALQYLLLDAAEQIHAGPNIFQKAGQFPAAETIDLPLSDEARQFYKSGKPFFQRHLPFWLAVLMDRLLVLLIPLVGVIYPLVQLLPKLYDNAMRQRIYRLYGELRLLETELDSRGAGSDINDLLERFDRLEEKANRLQLPATYGSMVYTLRDHIVPIRRRLRDQETSGTK